MPGPGDPIGLFPAYVCSSVRTRAAARRYPRAGNRRPGCRTPGRPGTAVTSATPGAALALVRRRPGFGGSSPPHPVPQAEQLTLDPPVPPPGDSAGPACSTSSQTSCGTGGRPAALEYVHFLLSRRRCQASNVPGVTIRCNCRRLGSSRATAAITARSAQSGLGRVTCRRKTATSCRSTKISASLAASFRASSTSQPNTNTMKR